MYDSIENPNGRFVVLYHKFSNSSQLSLPTSPDFKNDSYSKSDQSKSDQSKSDQSKSDQSKSDQSKGNQSKGNHWDLMFECDGQLLTWSVETEPFKALVYDAMQLPNHRLAYLTYEGPVSGNRGAVNRTLAGNFYIDCDGAPAKSLSEWVLQGNFRLRIIFENLNQEISFRRVKGSHWILSMTANLC